MGETLQKIFLSHFQGSRKENIFVMAMPLRGEGGGGKGLAFKKKKKNLGLPFFSLLRKFRLTLSSRGGGGKALMALPLRK